MGLKQRKQFVWKTSRVYRIWENNFSRYRKVVFNYIFFRNGFWRRKLLLGTLCPWNKKANFPWNWQSGASLCSALLVRDFWISSIYTWCVEIAVDLTTTLYW